MFQMLEHTNIRQPQNSFLEEEVNTYSLTQA